MLTPAHPPPGRFYPLLLAFHIFPLHAPITLWLLDAPFGKFAIPSALNLPGNLAWAAMELVAVRLHWPADPSPSPSSPPSDGAR
jgi:3-oxo-5-alpha-steroid 4-dehydrogenase 1